MKPSRTKGKVDHQSKATEDDLDQVAGPTIRDAAHASGAYAVAGQAWMRSLMLRSGSIDEEGTISAKELLKEQHGVLD